MSEAQITNLPPYWRSAVAGAALTSMKVGGDVAYLAQPSSLEEVQTTLHLARELALPVRFWGGGSNVLLPDKGLQVVLLQPLARQKEVNLAEVEAPEYSRRNDRYGSGAAGFLQLHDDNFDLSNVSWRKVRLGAGVPWGQAVAWSLQQQMWGLHYFARIPCWVGGAVYNNIHSGQHLLSQFIESVTVIDTEQGELQEISHKDMVFGYDYSILHEQPKWCVWEVALRLPYVSARQAAAAQAQYLAWTKAKTEVQPSGPNAGSTFQNLTSAQAASVGQIQVAAAWYIDQAGLKGKQVGGMQVYPGHANFICNLGQGTQADFIDLVTQIQTAVHALFGLWLQPEVECWDEFGNPHRWNHGA